MIKAAPLNGKEPKEPRIRVRVNLENGAAMVPQHQKALI